MTIYEHTFPLWLIIAAVLSALGIAGFTFWRFTPRSLKGWIVLAAHAVFVLLLAWCMLLPGRKSEEVETLKPRFVVAVDTSTSMLLTPRGEAVSNRWDTARQVLNMPWVKSIAAECELDVYRFDAELSKTTMDEIREATPEGTATLLRDATQNLSRRYTGINVVGALILTDGVDTREAFDDWSTQHRSFPFYTVRLEPEASWEVDPDVRVDSIQTPRRVTVHWKTELKAFVSGQGTANHPVTVQLFRDNSLLEERPVQIPADGGSRHVTFDLTHSEVGVFTYRVYIPPLPGESNTNDNVNAVSVQVIDARNRLLYVDGPPRWESKYLRRALDANKQATPVIFLQGPGGKPISFGATGSMTPDMTEQQLSFFKVVIIGNLDAEALGPRRVESLIKYVESGGSLALLGGKAAWGPKGYVSSDLRRILPVRRYNPTAVEGEFPARLTDIGRTHPAFAGDPTLWDVIPPVLSYFPNVEPTPGAQVLVEVISPQGPQPIILSQRYGQGKVVAFFTDTLWKWQLHPNAIENRPYQRFWEQMIAWMLPEEDEVDGSKIDLQVDKDSLMLGEEVTISARYQPAGGEVVEHLRCEVETADGMTSGYAMRPDIITTSTGETYPGFVTTYKGEQGGLHRVVAMATVDGVAVTSDPVAFYVKPFSAESVQRPINTAVLMGLAENSGGLFFNDLDSLNDELSALTFEQTEKTLTYYKRLWQTWLMLGLLLAAATVGWVTRKLGNMP